MAKLVLSAAPTFTAQVAIPVPGKKPVNVEFTFKGRTRDAFTEFLTWCEGRDDLDVLLNTISGWELEDAFCEEAVNELIQSYPGAARAIIEKYIREQTGARLGN
jgi:hypothetical protein